MTSLWTCPFLAEKHEFIPFILHFKIHLCCQQHQTKVKLCFALTHILITKYVQPIMCTLEVFGKKLLSCFGVYACVCISQLSEGFEVHVSLFFDVRGLFLFMHPEGLPACLCRWLLSTGFVRRKREWTETIGSQYGIFIFLYIYHEILNSTQCIYARQIYHTPLRAVALGLLNDWERKTIRSFCGPVHVQGLTVKLSGV